MGEWFGSTPFSREGALVSFCFDRLRSQPRKFCLGLYTLELCAVFYLHGIQRACSHKSILFDLFCVVSGYMETRHLKRWKSKVKCRRFPIPMWKAYPQWNPKEIVPVLVSKFQKIQDSSVIHSRYDSSMVHSRPFSPVVVFS